MKNIIIRFNLKKCFTYDQDDTLKAFIIKSNSFSQPLRTGKVNFDTVIRHTYRAGYNNKLFGCNN